MGLAKYAYVVSAPGGPYAFVPAPEPHRWIRTHPCVLVVACEVCGAEKGSPCQSRQGYAVGYTHYQRRRAGRKWEGVAAAVVVALPRRGR